MTTTDRRYSNLKPFIFPEQIAALRERRLVAPTHIRIKPTNRCNHGCWYCAYRHDDLQLGDDMDLADSIPTDKMFEIIDDIVAMDVKAVTFSGGGEPTIYKRLPECVERLAMGGVRAATLTNGSNLKGRVAEAFARFGTWVRVSLDAWEDNSYADARGIKSGTFTKLIDNLKAFSSSGTDCELGVSFIVSVENHAHIHEACRIGGAAGARNRM
jgi:MoaA/NifB/PqqE/SkfB family radical SAM enzyme